MKTKIDIGYNPKTVALENGEYLHFWYANNQGRGNNNCTIVRTHNKLRMDTSQKQIDDECSIRYIRTSAWRGDVNFSAAVQSNLGL